MTLEEQNENVRYKYSPSSLSKLEGVSPKMVRFAFAIAQIIDCTIVSGVRTEQEQREKYDKGLSSFNGTDQKSSHQKHSDGYGYALDILPLPNGVNMYLDDGSEDNIRWAQFDGMCHSVAYSIGIKVKTGFKWRSSMMDSLARPERENTLPDGNHVELYV